MPSPIFVPNAVPKNVQGWGIGREPQGAAGTVVAPATFIPLTAGLPTDQPNMLMDQALRGDMGEDSNMIVGTELAGFPLAGDVYLDSIGHLLYNLFGEYQAAFVTAGSAAGTTTAPGAVGATTLTGTAFTVGLTAGTLIQVTTSSGASEIVVLSATSTATTLTFATTPLRFSHATGTTVTSAAAGAAINHTFKLLNPNAAAAVGLPANAQGCTHTITYNNGLAATTGQRQYPYWCSSGIDFSMDVNNLFTHSTKGTSMLGIDNTGAIIANSQGAQPAQPNWRFAVGIGGPASGGTLVNNVDSASISPARALANKFALANQQSPVIIGRLGFTATGKLTFIAQDESPLLSTLAGTQQQLQIAMTNGLAGNNLAGITFNFQLAQYEQPTLADPDMMQWDVNFRGLRNTTDAGITGGKSPMSVVLTNAIATY